MTFLRQRANMPVAFSIMGTILDSFDRSFRSVSARTIELLKSVSDADLFRRPRETRHSMAMFSCGEYVLRSAGTIEQTCGGITTRLWDDPFEWTLPEELSTVERVLGYVEEVEARRVQAFRFFTADDDLLKQIPAPETLRTIHDLLLGTLARAEHFQGRAFAIYQVISDEKLPQMGQ